MAQHEKKYCPRCNISFECKVGSILQCQCNGITFTDTEWDYVRLTYTDCLCRHCLQAIRHEISSIAIKQKMNAILAPIKKQ